MKAKKNLYEAPVTEVVSIVMNVMSDCYDLLTDEGGKFYEQNIDAMVETLTAFSEWNLPKELMKEYLKGNLDDRDIEEEIINATIKEYHKSKAA